MMQQLNADFSASYSLLWKRFRAAYTLRRLPHALLMVSPHSPDMVSFFNAMAAMILCLNENKPCGACQSCHLIKINQHPDIVYLKPEKPGGIIKIDQIRALQPIAFMSPQLGENRLIFIHPAENMNLPAANALLKLLEEPPDSVSLILVAEQIGTILPTILSRCQRWHVPFVRNSLTDYLTLGENYPQETARGKLFGEHELIIQDLLNLVAKRISICELAAKWAIYELNELVWLIYLINCQMINCQFLKPNGKKAWTQQVCALSQYFYPPALFYQLDELNTLIKKLNQNISVNHILAVENLLLGYQKLVRQI
jgi:DNA polymerase-3 subunit delta'